MKIYSPIVEHMKLQIRFNLRTRNVEIRSGPETEDIGHVQKAAEFVKVSVIQKEVLLLIFLERMGLRLLIEEK